MHRTAPIVTTGLVMVAFVLAGIPTAQAADHHVHTVDFSFQPDELVIEVGDSVNWDNHDGVTHTVTDKNCERAGGPGPCEFDSIFTMTPGKSFAHTFTFPAVFEYKCTIHGFDAILNVGGIDFNPDLVIESLTFADNSPPSNVFAKRVIVTVRNDGNQGSGSTNLLVEYFYQDAWHVIANPAVNPLVPGATQTLVQPWTHTGKIGDFLVRVTADSNNVEEELEEENNQAEDLASLILPPGTLEGIDLLNPV